MLIRNKKWAKIIFLYTNFLEDNTVIVLSYLTQICHDVNLQVQAVQKLIVMVMVIIIYNWPGTPSGPRGHIQHNSINFVKVSSLDLVKELPMKKLYTMVSCQSHVSLVIVMIAVCMAQGSHLCVV